MTNTFKRNHTREVPRSLGSIYSSEHRRTHSPDGSYATFVQTYLEDLIGSRNFVELPKHCGLCDTTPVQRCMYAAIYIFLGVVQLKAQALSTSAVFLALNFPSFNCKIRKTVSFICEKKAVSLTHI